MARSLAAAFVLGALLASGCVPVTTPVGDIDKAVPDTKLLGTWREGESDTSAWVVDRPDVKGNPDGLLRARGFRSAENLKADRAEDTIWFFATTVGKVTYVNALIADGGGYADLSKEGAFPKWAKTPRYWLALLAVEGDMIRVYVPDRRGFETLMKDNKVKEDDDGYYTLAPGKLEKLFDTELGGKGLPEDTGTKLTRVKGK